MENTYSQCSERVSKGNRYSRNHNHDSRDFSSFTKNDPFRIFLGVYVCGNAVVPTTGIQFSKTSSSCMLIINDMLLINLLYAI